MNPLIPASVSRKLRPHPRYSGPSPSSAGA